MWMALGIEHMASSERQVPLALSHSLAHCPTLMHSPCLTCHQSHINSFKSTALSPVYVHALLTWRTCCTSRSHTSAVLLVDFFLLLLFFFSFYFYSCHIMLDTSGDIPSSLFKGISWMCFQDWAVLRSTWFSPIHDAHHSFNCPQFLILSSVSEQ